MSEFRTIVGARGLFAHQLSRFGEVSGGWRITRNGETLCECPHEIGARIMLKVLGSTHPDKWTWATAAAIHGMSKENA